MRFDDEGGQDNDEVQDKNRADPNQEAAHEAEHEVQDKNLAGPKQEAAHGEEEKGEELDRDLWYCPWEEWLQQKEEQKKEELKGGLWYSPSDNGGRAPPWHCLLYTSPSPRDQRGSRMPSSA